jgi:Protein of unknown function (DUF1501)
MDMRTRRQFFMDLGMGFSGVALAAMLHRDGFAQAGDQGVRAWQPPDGRPHFAPRAKNVIWLFMIGGTSHVESFDPKPALNRYAGKTIAETPFADALKSKLSGNLRVLLQDQPELHVRRSLYPLQVGYRKRGECGTEISDWWPHLGSCIDDVAVIRSMWTTDNDHGAQLQFHTGRHMLEGQFPTIGSWVHYGLGAENDDLPSFVVIGSPIADCCGGLGGHGASYLGPEHDGIQLSADPKSPLPFATPARDVFHEEQAGEFELLGRLNRLSAERYPDDPALRARIKSYELAFRMQTAVPEVMQLSGESVATGRLYGLDQDATRPFGEMCLAARRLVERGVRFVQVFHGSNGGAGAWDAHSGLRQNHAAVCAQVDKPIAGLLGDLKQRGLLAETIVVWATEFGRTPGSEGKDGRDHHPYGFSVWMAGGGVKGGIVHGATDEIGYHAVEDRHYVTDIHATLLHGLGLDAHRLEVPGHKRLEIDFGHVIRDILA